MSDESGAPRSAKQRFHSVHRALLRSLPSQSRLLIACSGGIDSSVLLTACSSLRATLSLDIAVAHVDHGFRDGSWRDAHFVAEQALSLGLPFFSTRLGALPARANLEAWGREQRYRFFSHVRNHHRFDWVCTAHTADDVIETLLMRLLAGRELNLIDERNGARGIIRPLLGVFRADIQSFADSFGVSFREDPTNQEGVLYRSRVRGELLPFLERFADGRIREVLLRQAAQLQEDGTALDALARERAQPWRGLTLVPAAELRRLRKTIEELPLALQWRIVQELLEPTVGFALGRRAALRALAVIIGSAVRCQLPGKVVVSRSGGALSIVRQEDFPSESV